MTPSFVQQHDPNTLLRLVARALPWVLAMAATPAPAQVYKCADPRGNVHYADRPCPTGQSRDYRPPELNRISPERLTGGTAAKKPREQDGWVSPLDPIANCRKQGGTFNREMRGCQLPP